MGESFPTCYEQFIEYGRQQGRLEAKQEVIQKGIQLGTFRTLFKLVEDGYLSAEEAAKSEGLTVNEFLEKKKEFSGACESS